eukprot:CAMPEP_0203861906 /NCGR_PEP_ID=MMETSP0359-20131031/13289_1 /ASSEMBLY_ACC=CAM_ASM_000338 /TAXON_ID=268821 /ORGANISM="Scrippsiella Hangoei, Strain SHTV-5" /LENGTH=97 /DNA_ID=CAMNT_0050779225 /DNA_START=108 /DNA_END=401 /DNA_ORIENTATION=-
MSTPENRAQRARHFGPRMGPKRPRPRPEQEAKPILKNLLSTSCNSSSSAGARRQAFRNRDKWPSQMAQRPATDVRAGSITTEANAAMTLTKSGQTSA